MGKAYWAVALKLFSAWFLLSLRRRFDNFASLAQSDSHHLQEPVQVPWNNLDWQISHCVRNPNIPYPIIRAMLSSRQNLSNKAHHQKGSRTFARSGKDLCHQTFCAYRWSPTMPSDQLRMASVLALQHVSFSIILLAIGPKVDFHASIKYHHCFCSPNQSKC